MELPEGTKFQVLAPMVRGRKGEYEKLLGDLARKGFPARGSTERCASSPSHPAAKNFKHTIEVVVDRLIAKPDIRRRVADSWKRRSSSQRASLPSRSDARWRRGDPELLAGARPATFCGIVVPTKLGAELSFTRRNGRARR